MRPVEIKERVSLAPGVCVKCNMDHGDRKWFVDLGFDMDYLHNGDHVEGQIFLCNQCINDIFVSYSRALPEFLDLYEAKENAELIDLRAKAKEAQKEIKHLQGVLSDTKSTLTITQELVNRATKTEQSTGLDSLDASIIRHSPDVPEFETESELENGPNNDSDANRKDSSIIEDAGTDDSSSDISDSGDVGDSEEVSGDSNFSFFTDK